jgi:hypothetical protein
VETGVQALLAYVENTQLRKVRPCDVHKLVYSVKLREACGLHGIPNECSGIFKEDHWYIRHIYLIIAFGCPIFLNLGRKQNLQHY